MESGGVCITRTRVSAQAWQRLPGVVSHGHTNLLLIIGDLIPPYRHQLPLVVPGRESRKMSGG